MAESLLGDNQTPDERSEILNKWKDKAPAEVLNAKVESDLYIKSLTARFDDLSKDYLKLRDEHQASTDLKTLIETIKKERENPGTTVTTPSTETPTAIKPEEIRSLVRQENSQYQAELKQQENFRIVQAKLKETYGENYTTPYKQRLDQLGISAEYADELAKNQPKLFMKTFDLDNTQIHRNVNTLPANQHRPSFTPNAQKRDWNYYQEMKKSNPKMYLDPKIAIQMHNDAIELGEAFGMPQD